MYVFNNTWYVLLLLVVIEEVCACVPLCIPVYPVFPIRYCIPYLILYSLLDTVYAAITVFYVLHYAQLFQDLYSLFPTGSCIPY